MTTHDETVTRTLAQTYFTAWEAGDEQALRGILSPDATFRGPLGSADGVDACVAGLLGMRGTMQGIDVHAMVVEGDDVITFYDLRWPGADPTPTANWSHVDDGRIRGIRAAFDPRGILGAGDTA